MVVLGHRIIWSVLLLAVLVGFRGQWAEVRAVGRNIGAVAWLGTSTLFLAVNWLVFIHAIETDRLLDASLGYFINPLVTVVLGMVFLGERLRPGQWAAVAIAAAGVAYLSVTRGGLPWIGLALAASFGVYGLMRKKAPAGPVVGLFFETGLLAPFAAAYLAWAHTRPGAAGINTWGTLGLLSLSGIVTTVPLVWFAVATRRLRLVTIGFLQYINPTMQFLTAVLVFGEPFGGERVVAFGVIWIAVVVFAVDSARAAVREARFKVGSSRNEGAAA